VPPEQLSPERAIRLLRAKAGELEAQVHRYGLTEVNELRADIALVATLLADHMEHCGQDPT